MLWCWALLKEKKRLDFISSFPNFCKWFLKKNSRGVELLSSSEGRCDRKSLRVIALLYLRLFFILRSQMKSFGVKPQCFPEKTNAYKKNKNLTLWWSADQKTGHLYCVFSPGTRQIASNARFTQGPLSARQIFFIQGQCDSNYVSLAIYIFFAVGFWKNYINAAPSNGSITSYGEMPDKFSAHFP